MKRFLSASTALIVAVLLLPTSVAAGQTRTDTRGGAGRADEVDGMGDSADPGQTVPSGWNGPYGSILDDPGTAAQGARALRHLYDMNLEAARLVADSLKAAHPRHPIGPFLDGLAIWWQILPDLEIEDARLDRAFYRAMEETASASDRLLRRRRDNIDGIFFKAAALGFRGRHLSNRGEWLTAARDGKQALDLVFRLSERDPDNPDFQFGVGVYNYFASVIPEEYPVARPFMLFFPKADRQRGVDELERTAAKATYVGTEAAYFLLQIYLTYEPNYEESRRLVNLLRGRHPANGFFHLLEGRVYARWGRFSMALAAFERVMQEYDAGAPGYTDGLAYNALYNIGRSALMTGDPARALENLTRLETMTDDDPKTVYRALGRLRAGMAHDRLEQRDQALAAYRSVLTLPDVSRSHELARRYLERPFGT